MLRIRKIITYVEDVLIEGGVSGEPIRQAAVAAVMDNPWDGDFVSDLKPIILEMAPVLAERLVPQLLALCGGAEKVEAYGKAAVVGTSGEIEHASAFIHTLRFGNRFREAVGGTTFLHFTNTRGAAGASIMIPLAHKLDAGLRSHYNTIQFSVPDAPAPAELVVAIGASTGGRMHPRIGNRYEDMAEMGLAVVEP
jgi:hypothetical protein